MDLKQKILSGFLKFGLPVRQDDIAQDHNVSKIPVREALRRLETEGLVIFERNKRASVRHFTETEVLQLLDIRIALECGALELAVENMIDADFRDMRALLDAYANTAEIPEWSKMNARFHMMLYEPCGNPQLLNMINDLQQKLDKYLRLLVTEASGLERPMREYDEILAAFLRRGA